jgi:hypothetical protein
MTTQSSYIFIIYEIIIVWLQTNFSDPLDLNHRVYFISQRKDSDR